MATDATSEWSFNPPPNWPAPPVGWRPSPGWQPDPRWGPPPPGWRLWVPSRRDDGHPFLWTFLTQLVLYPLIVVGYVLAGRRATSSGTRSGP